VAIDELKVNLGEPDCWVLPVAAHLYSRRQQEAAGQQGHQVSAHTEP
jgi:hypothetical protein